jgi:colicin import membrane protein
MSTTKITALAALMVLLTIGSSAAEPASARGKSAADPANKTAKEGAKARDAAKGATAPKLTKQEAKKQAKEAARKAKIDAKKAERQAAKQAEKQARLAERKGHESGKAEARPAETPSKVPGLAEKMGRGALPPPQANPGGAERGQNRAAHRADARGLEKSRAQRRAEGPGATVKAKPPKGKAVN